MKAIRQFTELVGIVERGDAAQDMTIEIEKVIQGCRDAADSPKAKVKGEVTLKLSFVVEGQYLEIKADISSKIPKIKRGSTTLFLSKDGAITTEHPSQSDLFEVPRSVKAAE